MEITVLIENISKLLEINIFGMLKISDLIIMVIALIIALHVFRTLSRG